MNQTIGKYILLIEPDAAPLAVMAPGLKELGFTVLHASTPHAAMAVLAATPLLSLVAIEEGFGVAQGVMLLNAMKRAQPELPVLWVGEETRVPLSTGEHPPDAVLHPPVKPASLSATAELLLQESFYPAALSAALIGACSEVMQEAYKTTLTLESTRIRATGNALAPVNALLPFCGARLAGSLLVSAEYEHLARIRSRVLPSDLCVTQTAIEDVAGEFANLLAGRTKAVFAQYDLAFDLGTPILLSGTQINLRHRASRPSLVLTFRDRSWSMYVMLTFHLLDLDKALSWQLPSDPEISSGELYFL